ncbi:MAG: efflux transporter outer membrane subunit [Muribaculaceae bacterium]|nr:efflux transporter outer membrane subunit [Muribaculaceae bacterium]
MNTPNKIALLIMTATGASLTSGAVEPQQWLLDSLPQHWNYQSAYSQKLPTDDDWWKTFGDATLDSLINIAEKENYNISAALARIEMAKKTLDAAKSAYFPTVNLAAGWQKGQSSGATGPVVGKSSPYDYFSLGATMQWEVDLFGRITQNVKANKAAYNASKAEFDGTMVSLAANVAKAYINLRTYQNEMLVAQRHLAEQEKVLAIVEARFKAGLASMLEVTQSRTVVASTKSSIPALEAMIESSINSLALLTAHYPEDIYKWLSEPMPMPNVVYGAQLGVPADLLRRRPDIIQAEYQLAGYAAQVGIAKKDFLPTLSIAGSIGTQAHDAKNLFGEHSMYWEVSPTLSWTLFDGLARNYRTAEAKAQLEAAVDTYNYTVMNAVIEVTNATTTFKSAMKTIELTDDVIDNSKKSLDLSLELYKKGLTPFNNVVDAQISYLTNQDSQITAQGKALAAVVNLYEALGGGWNQRPSDQ